MIDTELSVREADEHDLPMLLDHYHLISPEELAEVVRRRSILLGYSCEQLVGFIGEHLEGSMGLLYIFPEYRRMGFAYALESAKIAEFLSKGLIPFAQVDKNNAASLALQKKLGMTRSAHTILWLWKLDD